MHDPAEARRHGRVPTYIWTGHEAHRKAYHVYRAHGTPPNWHAIYTVSGHGFFAQNGVRSSVRAGSLVLLGPKSEHDYGCDANGRWECLYAHFTPRLQWLELMKWPDLGERLHVLHLAPGRVRDAIEAAMWRCNTYRSAAFSQYAHELAMAALEEVLLLAAHEQSYAGAAPRLSGAIRKTIEYILEHLTRQHSIPALARVAQLSPSHFAHRFKTETGEAVISYIIRLRVQKAAALLEYEGKNVKEAAAACGFSSQFYFSRQFRQWYLISPSAFKRNCVAVKMKSPEQSY